MKTQEKLQTDLTPEEMESARKELLQELKSGAWHMSVYMGDACLRGERECVCRSSGVLSLCVQHTKHIQGKVTDQPCH